MSRILLSIGFLLTSSLASAQTEIKIATLAPVGSTWMKALERGAQGIAKVTEKRVTVKYYPGGVMGDEREAVKKIKLGQIDGAGVTSVGLAVIYPGIRVLEIPMLFESEREMSYVVNKMWRYFRKKFRQKGYYLGGPGEVGWVHFFSKKPIKSLQDMRSQKMWMWKDDKIVRYMYKKLGVNGVPLGVPQVLSSLTTGAISGAYASPLAAVALQWNNKVKYATSLRPVYGISSTLISMKSWKKVSDADKKAAKKEMKSMRKKLVRAVRRDNKNALKTMKRQGLKVVKTPPSVVAEYKKLSEEAWQEMAAKGNVYSKSELEAVLLYREEYRKKNAK